MSEPYDVRVTARADRDLRRLPEKIAAACVEFILGPLGENPQRLGKPLRAELEALHSARRGDYRVANRIDDATRTVDVVHVARRSDVYRDPT